MTSTILWFTTLSSVWNHQQHDDIRHRFKIITVLTQPEPDVERVHWRQAQTIWQDAWKHSWYDYNALRQKWEQGLVKAHMFCTLVDCMVKWDRSCCTGCAAVHLCALLLHCVKVGVQECLKNFCSLLLCSLLYSLKRWISRSFQHNESHWPNLSLKGNRGVLKHEVSRNTMFSELEPLGVKSEHMITTLLGWQKKI